MVSTYIANRSYKADIYGDADGPSRHTTPTASTLPAGEEAYYYFYNAHGDVVSLHRYTYCANNPLRYTDPGGHFFGALLRFVGGAVAGIGGVFGVAVDFYVDYRKHARLKKVPVPVEVERVHYECVYHVPDCPNHVSNIRVVTKDTKWEMQEVWEYGGTDRSFMDYLGDHAKEQVAGKAPEDAPWRKLNLQFFAEGADKKTKPKAMENAVWGEYLKAETPGKRGTLIGNLDKLTADERKMVEDLLSLGKDVKIIPKSNEFKVKTPDFEVNGIKTELKTINGISDSTPVKRIRKAFQQHASVVIIDARKTEMLFQDAEVVISRVKGIMGELPGNVEIWTKQGIFRR